MAKNSLNLVKSLTDTKEEKYEAKVRDAVKLSTKDGKILTRFFEIKQEIKELKKEEESLKENVNEFGVNIFCDRVFSGHFENFDMTDGKNKVMFVVQDKSSTMKESRYQELKRKWGNDIDKIVGINPASIKFNPEKLEKHIKEIHDALVKHLPEEVREGLFENFNYTAKPDVVKNIKEVAKEDTEKFKALFEDVNVTTMIK